MQAKRREAAERRPVASMFGGIQVNEPDMGRWVRALAASGLDSVQVTLYARQGRWDSPDLWFDTDATHVINEVRAAKHAGLSTSLVLRVALEHSLADNRHLWHGMIWPADDALEDWFVRYTEFVLWGARIAEREAVDLLVIGNELNSMSSTVPVSGLPDLYAYYLDPVRMGRVRQQLVGCASQVDAGSGVAATDLRWLDGGRHTDLDSMLRAQERRQRDWARTIVGAGLSREDLHESGIRLINARRRILESNWRRLIGRARSVYGGPVTYGANFDQFGEVGFWDALDALGVNAYFPLSLWGLEPEHRRRHMRSSWERIAVSVEDIAREADEGGSGLPVFLVEMGWTRKAGSTVRPYSYERVDVLESLATEAEVVSSPPLTCVHWLSQPQDASERVAALEALAEVVADGGFRTLRGFTLWKLSTLREHRTIEPFVAILSGGSWVPEGKKPAGLDASEDELHDREYLAQAVSIARWVRQRETRGLSDAAESTPRTVQR